MDGFRFSGSAKSFTYKRHSVTKNKRKILKALALTRRILLLLAKETKDALYQEETIFKSFPYWRSDWTLEDEEWAERAQAKRALRDLKQKKFIEIRKQGNAVMYRLTDKGRIAALKDRIRLADKYRNRKLILVSFDIPEQENTIRVRLRRLLKDIGFKRVQQSLWASDLNIGGILAKTFADIKADKWVRVFESSEIKKRYFIKK